MKLNKIGLVLVSLSSVFFAPSCKQAQKITYEQAKTWVSKNCVEGKSTSTGGYQFFDYSKTFGETARAYIKSYVEKKYPGVELNENLICKQQKPESTNNNLTVKLLKGLSYDGDALFNILNNRITITTTRDLSGLADFEGKIIISNQYDKKGKLRLSETALYYVKALSFGERAAIIGTNRLTYNY